MKYKIIDNFLDKKVFKEFKTKLFSNTDIPWFYRKSQDRLRKENTNPWFSLGFFNKGSRDFPNLDKYLYVLYKQLKCKELIESRANLCLKPSIKNKPFFHVDFEYPNVKTCIFYMNTTNGGTWLKIKNKKILVKCIENRALVFDSLIEHAAQQHTDIDRRVVINVNYFV